MKKRVLSLLLVASMAFSMFAACGKKEVVDEEPVVEEETEVEVTEEDSDTFFQEKNEEGKVRSYLSGKWVDEEIGRRRPFALMVENTKACLPQYGVADADIIYECPVEGSITRMMAIWEDYENIERLGNVRSARPYYVYFASEYEAIYGHAGGNPAAFGLIDDGLVEDLDGLDGDLSSSMYFRANNASAPHNLYTSGEGVVKGIEKRGYNTSYSDSYNGHFKFSASGTDLADGEDCEAIQLYYFYNEPYFIYNEEDQRYYRYEFGSKQIDASTNEQLSCDNIILQSVLWWTYEGSEYLGMFLPGYSGEGKYITKGKMIDITWSKDGDSDVTHYYDLEGNEIKLNIGNTWVCVCQCDYYPDNKYYASADEFKGSK